MTVEESSHGAGGKTALVFGASGLVGSHLLWLLLESEKYKTVIAAVRKPLLINHPKLKQETVDFDRLEGFSRFLAADDVFCCLGTTIKKAKSRDAFKRVDLEYPLAVGRLCLHNNVKRLLVVSSIGADSGSSFFYSRVKGAMEKELSGLGLPSLYFFRPSLLLGARREIRFGESAAGFFAGKLASLMQGPLRKYKPIEARMVAMAMLDFAQKDGIGIAVVDSQEIQQYAKSR